MGTLSLFLLSCGLLHLRVTAYSQLRLMYIYLFLLGVFFFGLRYGFFNSIHSFVGSTQLDFRTRAPLYFLGVAVATWRRPRLTSHYGVNLLLILGTLCLLAFV